MLAVDTVELGLQRQTGGFFLIEGNLSCPRVASKVTHVAVKGEYDENK
jgi:hypothetical protein